MIVYSKSPRNKTLRVMFLIVLRAARLNLLRTDLLWRPVAYASIISAREFEVIRASEFSTCLLVDQRQFPSYSDSPLACLIHLTWVSAISSFFRALMLFLSGFVFQDSCHQFFTNQRVILTFHRTVSFIARWQGYHCLTLIALAF